MSKIIVGKKSWYGFSPLKMIHYLIFTNTIFSGEISIGKSILNTVNNKVFIILDLFETFRIKNFIIYNLIICVWVIPPKIYI